MEKNVFNFLLNLIKFISFIIKLKNWNLKVKYFSEFALEFLKKLIKHFILINLNLEPKIKYFEYFS